MIKKILWTLGSVVTLVVAVALIAPVFVGKTLENRLPTILKGMNNLPSSSIRLVSFDRHWFYSTANILWNGQPLTIDIAQGPVAFQNKELTFAWADYQVKSSPVPVHGEVAYNGDLTINVEKFASHILRQHSIPSDVVSVKNSRIFCMLPRADHYSTEKCMLNVSRIRSDKYHSGIRRFNINSTISPAVGAIPKVMFNKISVSGVSVDLKKEKDISATLVNMTVKNLSLKQIMLKVAHYKNFMQSRKGSKMMPDMLKMAHQSIESGKMFYKNKTSFSMKGLVLNTPTGAIRTKYAFHAGKLPANPVLGDYMQHMFFGFWVNVADLHSLPGDKSKFDLSGLKLNFTAKHGVLNLLFKFNQLTAEKNNFIADHPSLDLKIKMGNRSKIDVGANILLPSVCNNSQCVKNVKLSFHVDNLKNFMRTESTYVDFLENVRKLGEYNKLKERLSRAESRYFWEHPGQHVSPMRGKIKGLKSKIKGLKSKIRIIRLRQANLILSPKVKARMTLTGSSTMGGPVNIAASLSFPSNAKPSSQLKWIEHPIVSADAKISDRYLYLMPKDQVVDIKQKIKSGRVKQKDGMLSTHIELKGHVLTLNGLPAR